MISFPFAKLSVRDKTAEGVFVGRMSLFCKSILLQMDCCNRPLYKYSNSFIIETYNFWASTIKCNRSHAI